MRKCISGSAVLFLPITVRPDSSTAKPTVCKGTLVTRERYSECLAPPLVAQCRFLHTAVIRTSASAIRPNR